MKRDRLLLSSTSNSRRRWGRIDEESEQDDDNVGHCTTLQNSAAMVSDSPPPPKKVKKSESDIAETELGIVRIFPDIPDARLKMEFDEATSFDLSEEGTDDDSVYITAEENGSELETNVSTVQQSAFSDDNIKIKVEESKESAEGLHGIKMKAFPDDRYVQTETELTDAPIKKEFNSDGDDVCPHDDLFDGGDDGVTIEVTADGLVTPTGAAKPVAEYDDDLHETSKVEVEEGEVPMLETESIIKMEVFPDSHYVQAKTEWDSENEDPTNSKLHGQEAVEPEAEKGKKTDDSRRCIYCRFVCSHCGMNKRKEKMDLHLARYHPQHFFSNEREKVFGVKRNLFQRVLVDFLYPEFFRKIGAQRSCTLCEVKYQCSEWTRNELLIGKHLVMEHKNALKARLKTILEDEGLGLEAKLTGSRSEWVWCRCGVHLPRWPMMQTRHKQLYCKLVITDDASDSNKGSVGSEGVCEKLSQKPKDNLARENPEGVAADDSHRQKGILESAETESGKSNTVEGRHQKCHYCRFKCRATTSEYRRKYDLQLHYSRYHPEHLFLEEKEQLSGEKRKQFQRILVAFLFPKFIKNTGNHRTCTLCPTKYQNSSWDRTYIWHRRHLALEHKKEMREKLRTILEDESLEDKLIRSWKVEAWCRCGMYLPRESKIHKYSYCNLTASNDEDNTVINQPSSKLPEIDQTRDISSKCTYCDCEFAKGSGNPMEMHLVQCHPEHYFTEEREKAFGLGLNQEVFQKLFGFSCQQFIRKCGISRCCALCEKKYSNVDVSIKDFRIRRHLISVHKDKLKEKLQLILEDISRGARLHRYM